jgi:hypothetical protein
VQRFSFPQDPDLAGQLGVQSPPSIDHHQHLFSPATAALAPGLVPVSAADLVKLLDDAGIRRAAVFSVAYQFGNPNRPSVDDEYAKVRAENDWTSQEVARFPDRLRGFCGINPPPAPLQHVRVNPPRVAT